MTRKRTDSLPDSAQPSPAPTKPPAVPQWVTVVIALLVSVTWTASMAADILLRDKYDPNPLVHAAMMLVLGTIFGVSVVRK